MVHSAFLVAILVLVVLTVIAAALATLGERWAQTRGLALARRRLADQLGTDAVTLDAPDRPLLIALLRGTRVDLRADDLPVGDGAMLRSLEATIHDVRAEVRGRVVTTGLGTFVARIEERELGALVRLPGVVSRLELGPTGLRVWTVLGIAVEADVLVHDGALRVIPDPGQVATLLQLPGVGAFRRAVEGAGLRLELPPLPFDAIVETLTFRTGEVLATGRLAPQRLPLR
ncbi:hypothetical protein [Nitriliruptor alkaliphilus]|uniref:hypothetical protein n=1 Tax=Nitriliruptor alkaliphilus TaxID=427918 RepID=UPI0006988FF4|nr:hypothetical protein [Nitriliruptor alkaliphilus]